MAVALQSPPISRVLELEQRIAYLEQENRELKAERRWQADLFAVPHTKMSDAHKLTLLAIHNELQGRDLGEYDYTKVDTARLASSVAQPTGTFLKNVAYLQKKLKVLNKKRESIHTADSKHAWTSAIYVAPKEVEKYPRLYSVDQERQHGGADRGQGRTPHCEKCGSLEVDVITAVLCRTCSHISSPTTTSYGAKKQVDSFLVETPAEDIAPSKEDESSEPENHQLDDLTTTYVPNNQVDCLVDAIMQSAETPEIVDECEDEVRSIVLSNNPPPKFTLESFLEQRIGHGPLIYATGSLVTSDKYFSFKTGHTPLIEKYLKGDREYIYGSRLALPDGKTNVISFDIDIKYPELFARRMEFMRCLAAAGVAVCAWLRRDGSVHIEAYFSQPVDAAAAYAWLCDICPALREIAECYPVADKADCALSWPFYYRIDAKVFPCALEYIPAYGPSVKTHPGITDRNGLTAILAQCITPASLIPPLPIVGDGSNNVTNLGGGVIG